ncbi:hypothetical protein FB45DRAFT_874021 [Roridomyces roridus]|uniref:Uncharacterized protein n=1 Tax=Roridomyces roridus TaxID=1738132 RepID=A0AAD7B982_9AGAR|nr:hypothetical protein FB45DRAFT_874021 [Roridomyces roridus]
MASSAGSREESQSLGDGSCMGLGLAGRRVYRAETAPHVRGATCPWYFSLIIDVLGAFHLGLSESFLSPLSDWIPHSGTPVRSLSRIAGQTVTLDLSGVTVPPTFARNSGPTIFSGSFDIDPELRSNPTPGDFISRYVLLGSDT